MALFVYARRDPPNQSNSGRQISIMKLLINKVTSCGSQQKANTTTLTIIILVTSTVMRLRLWELTNDEACVLTSRLQSVTQKLK